MQMVMSRWRRSVPRRPYRSFALQGSAVRDGLSLHDAIGRTGQIPGSHRPFWVLSRVLLIPQIRKWHRLPSLAAVTRKRLI